MGTIIVYAPGLAHTKAYHPESHKRTAGLLDALEEYGVLGDLTAVSPTLATAEQLQRVHTPRLIHLIQQTSLRGGGMLDQGDTYATRESYELARLAVGGCCTAVDQIMLGKARNGFAIVRPPGHHAARDSVSGFCLFNNVAAAARHAQHVHGVKRVLIVDFDVHHGDGTQDIFYADDSVMFASMHLFAPYFYPGIGSLQESGAALGKGYTLNVPFPPGVGDLGYARVLREHILPAAAQFQPELILVSAGFDAHWRDPLAMAGLSLRGYAQIAQTLISLAEQVCNGRILFVLEGGYEHDVLTYGVVNLFNALLGRDKVLDPFGNMREPERDIADLLGRLRAG